MREVLLLLKVRSFPYRAMVLYMDAVIFPGVWYAMHRSYARATWFLGKRWP